MMNAQEIIAYIAAAEKKTPVKVYVNELADIDYGSATVFGEGRSKVGSGTAGLGPHPAEKKCAILPEHLLEVGSGETVSSLLAVGFLLGLTGGLRTRTAI